MAKTTKKKARDTLVEAREKSLDKTLVEAREKSLDKIFMAAKTSKHQLQQNGAGGLRVLACRCCKHVSQGMREGPPTVAEVVQAVEGSSVKEAPDDQLMWGELRNPAPQFARLAGSSWHEWQEWQERTSRCPRSERRYRYPWPSWPTRKAGWSWERWQDWATWRSGPPRCAAIGCSVGADRQRHRHSTL